MHPGVRRLCVTLAGVRAGAKAGWAGRGAEGGAPFPAAGPALPPIGWALPPSGGRGGQLARSIAARGASRQPGDRRSPPPEQPQAPVFAPGTLPAAPGQGPAGAFTAAAHRRRFLSAEAPGAAPAGRCTAAPPPPTNPSSRPPHTACWKPTANASSGRAFRLCAPVEPPQLPGPQSSLL